MEKQIDLRIQKTKKNIYESFVKLLEFHSFETIKVSEICEKAMINRSTFYVHCEDKYALLDSFIKDLKQELKSILDTNEDFSNIKEYYMRLLELLLEHIESKKDIYMEIMIHNRNSVAMDMIYDTLAEDVASKITKHQLNSSVPASFLSTFYLGAIFNIGMEWIRSGKYFSKEEILKYLDVLIVT